jgi:hypothetical protein
VNNSDNNSQLVNNDTKSSQFVNFTATPPLTTNHSPLTTNH